MRARGFDVSEYNNVDWPGVRPEDASFVGIRTSSGGGTSEGVYTDKKLASHYAGAKSINALVFPYHFCLMGNPPEAEAEAFYSVASSYDWDLPWALDVENQSDLLSIPVDAQVDWIIRHANRVADLSGRMPMLYSFRYQFSNQWANSPRAKELHDVCGYWPADLSKGAPPAEAASPYQASYLPSWWFWQCSGNVNGTTNPTPGSQVLPGFHGMAVDQNVFNGDLAALQAFAADPSAMPGPDPATQSSLKARLAAIAPGQATPASGGGIVRPLVMGGLIVGAGYGLYKYGPTWLDMLKGKLARA